MRPPEVVEPGTESESARSRQRTADPRGLGLDGVAHAHGRGDRLVHVGEDACGDAGEERRAVRGALLAAVRSSGSPSTEATILSQRSAPRAAAGDAGRRRARRRAARRSSSESRRPKATPSSTARTSAPRSWRSERPAKAARALGSTCGVRSPVRYGRNVSPSTPGGHGSASATTFVGRFARRDDVAQPAERAGRGEHHAHRVPAAGHGVAEGVHAAVRIGGEARERRRRRRPRCRARRRAGPVRPPRRRAHRRPGHRRPRRPARRPRSGRAPATRAPWEAIRAGSRARP